ncbi:MAG TPA: penicillin-binding protein 2 [Anaerolineales bacterium]|nr:penicillin-binding protein 2 [Anaerolineales bacterium]HMV96027.1 penicillin-binding protein 2 [Anaerolineales bacterium]HMX74464.1 penicillin-binding protein 2 [Anaerolineales bacterium]HNE68440.1 penicillin-binding protein 2 [Anaerolineales bacterium]HNH79700.1 penicillin-binding protein 2 [Anaerolineales bacterium]
MSSNSVPRSVRFEAWRLVTVYVVVVLVFVAFLVRLLRLQVIEGANWKTSAVDNYTFEVSVPAPRGIIYDRNGYILARNVASYNIIITPANLPDDDSDIQAIYRDLSDLLDVPVGGRADDEALLEEAKLFGPCVPGPGITQLVALQDSLAPYSPVKIKCNVTVEIARIVEEKSVDWPGVTVEIEPIRDYPTGSLTSALVGFLGPIPASLEEEFRAQGFIPNRDKIGYAGVEDSLQEILAGRNGLRVVQVDVAGQELRNLEPPIPAVPGNNVTLTIDTRLQAVAEASLIQEINFWNDYFDTIRISSGVVIAMNPKTGEILAMVSYPTYENNRFARFIPAYYYEQLSQDPRHPLLNNAISAEFPPGSVFKLSTATGSFNEGVIGPDDIVDAPGKLELCEKFNPNDPCTGLNTRPFVDHIFEKKPEGFGPISFYQCIAYSSNVCFYKLGGGYQDEIEQGLGIERLQQYARALGYDQPSGIELKGEQDGLIPDPKWKRINTGENWSTGDTYIASVGQGYVLATPLQILMSGATIANNGKLMQPTIIREVTDGDGKPVDIWFNPDPEVFTATDFEVPGSYQISPFTPNLKWDVTVTPLIQSYSCDAGYCDLNENDLKTIRPESVAAVRAGTRLAVTDPFFGTLYDVFNDFPIAVAGKTGTAEYCDDVARKADQCDFGKWPTHSWTLAYAPYDDPEIIVVAFAYHGGEGASVAAPIVSRVIKAYFEFKALDIAQGNPALGQ